MRQRRCVTPYGWCLTVPRVKDSLRLYLESPKASHRCVDIGISGSSSSFARAGDQPPVCTVAFNPTSLEYPTFSASRGPRTDDARDLYQRKGELWARNRCLILPTNAENLRHGTDGFTALPKEGALRIFSPLKIRCLRPGSNPRPREPGASESYWNEDPGKLTQIWREESPNI
jgi:hypothetical protein